MNVFELLELNKLYGIEIELKPMRYYPRRKIELLANAKYSGYEFYIINFGTHPCAYIRIPGANKYYGVDYTNVDEDIDLPVNGGLTYSNNELQIDEFNTEKGWFIGWDYCHCNDYSSSWEKGRKWTTEEILQEVINAIEELKNDR